MQFQEINYKFLEKYLKNSLIFHSHSCRVHSCRFFVLFLFFGWPSKTSSKLDRIGKSGPNLIKCHKIRIKTTKYTVKCDKNYEKWVGYMFFGDQTQLVHDTKWGGVVGPLQFSQFPTYWSWCPFEDPLNPSGYTYTK